jgi:hypothetical protein
MTLTEPQRLFINERAIRFADVDGRQVTSPAPIERWNRHHVLVVTQGLAKRQSTLPASHIQSAT